METILSLKNISKTFPGVNALKDVSISFEKGEVHALVGENGAGKSTLIKTCTGAHMPTSGKIEMDGKVFSGFTPAEALGYGINAIYQEFNLVNDLSVAENIFLGNAIRKGIFVDRVTMAKKSAELFEELQIEVNPNEMVRNLTVGYQQMVEIAKALSKNARILIMDEPSAPLTTKEVETMFRVVRTLKERGVTIIYISHRLDEIFEIADRVSVLRDGELIKTMSIHETNKNQLISLMVGRELKETYPPRGPVPENSEIILDVEGLTGNGVENISFKVRRGEILGFGGLIGAGRTETAELLFGVKKPKSGKFVYNGKERKFRIPSDALKSGIALVPEDRKKQGILAHLSIRENIALPIMKELSKCTFIKNKKINEIVHGYYTGIRIKAPDTSVLVNNLSGGNQQKVVLAKCLATGAELIIFDEPTRGIDVGARHEIYQLMNDLVSEGKAILMISSDMEELLGMSDRILVLREGRITGELQKNDFGQERVLQYASQ